MQNTKKADLATGSLKSIFWKYTLPSIAMMVVMSIYFVVDVMFVGRGIGSTALAAVNLCIPLIMGISSVVMALSIGASIAIAIRLGRGEDREASNIFSLLFWMNIVFAVLVMSLGLVYSSELAYLLGANADTIDYVKKYLSIIFYFLPFFTLQNTLSCIVRNDGNPNLSLIASGLSSLINIPLDYLLIFGLSWGITGAALATGFAQVVATVILLWHFIASKGKLRFVLPKFDAPVFRQQIKNSIPVFISSASIPFFMFIMNVLAGKYYGTLGVSAYAITGSIALFSMTIFVGISQGIQPIISFNLGANKPDRIKATLKMALSYSNIIALVLIFFIYFFPEFIIALYVKLTPEILSLTIMSIRIYLIGFLFMGINMILVSYLQAMENNKAALAISVFRTFIIFIIVALFLPIFFGAKAVWYVIPLTEIITFLAILIFYFRKGIRV